MKRLSILGGLLLASSIHAQSSGWEATADQACVPDFRPAEDGIALDGAVHDVVADGELTMVIDGDADGRGDRLLRLRPEDGAQLELLRELAAEAIEFELFAWGSAAKTVRLGNFGSSGSTWLAVRTSECPLPDAWVQGRDVLMLESLTWIRTPDGPELDIDDPPVPAEIARAVSRYGLTSPTRCQAGGPGAMFCGLTLGEASCLAACTATDEYACCTPVACGCEPVAAEGD